MKKSLKLVALLFAMLTLTFSLVGCKDTPATTPSVTPSDDGIPVLSAEDTHLLITADADASGTLMDLMQEKAAEGEFTYTVADGMITSINGIENPAVWSYCWMIYTTDSEFSVVAYGQYKLNGTVYTSAAVGAEVLPVKGGEKYLWVYVAF